MEGLPIFNFFRTNCMALFLLTCVMSKVIPPKNNTSSAGSKCVITLPFGAFVSYLFSEI